MYMRLTNDRVRYFIVDFSENRKINRCIIFQFEYIILHLITYCV